MADYSTPSLPWWSFAFPAAALGVFVLYLSLGGGVFLYVVAGALLIGAVFASVHHAEVVAHRIGEPYGTIVLAVAVTVIEVALIVSAMASGGPGAATIARDTVFAAVMIACNGIVGLCLLAGGIRHHEQAFRLEGANAALAVLTALTTLTLVLPNVTTTAPGPSFSPSQLVFAGLVSLVLYGSFVFIQTVRHRDYFLDKHTPDHGEPPSNGMALVAFGMLLVALTAVVLIAKVLTPTVEAGVRAIGAPYSAVGIVIAILVLLPEGMAAVRAARANRVQESLNLALGSALASIGLTIPTVAAVSLATGASLTLGLAAKEQILLALTLLTGLATLGAGRTTVLQGVIHIVICAAFVFLAIVP